MMKVKLDSLALAFSFSINVSKPLKLLSLLNLTKNKKCFVCSVTLKWSEVFLTTRGCCRAVLRLKLSEQSWF